MRELGGELREVVHVDRCGLVVEVHLCADADVAEGGKGVVEVGGRTVVNRAAAYGLDGMEKMNRLLRDAGKWMVK